MAEVSSFGTPRLRRNSTLSFSKPTLAHRSSLTAFSLRESTPSLHKAISVTFLVDASVKMERTIELVGNCGELGNWTMGRGVRLKTDAESYPLWKSDPISFDVLGEDFELEYRFVEVEVGERGRECILESFESNRKLKFVLKWTDSLECTIENTLHVPSSQEINTLDRYSLLYALDAHPTSSSKISHILAYFTHKGRDCSLKDFVSACFFFKKLSTEEIEGDRDENTVCQNLGKIAKVMCRLMTEEIQPIVMKILVYMSRCSQQFKEQMKSITNVKLVQKHKLELGCDSEMLGGLLDELFSSSPKDDMGMIRVIVLNSIRSVLKSLRCKSTKSEVLLMYEVWIALLQRSYIETQFLSSDLRNEGNLIHQVAIIAESVGLSCVCVQEMKMAEQLSEMEREEDMRKVLIRMIDAATLWISRYVTAASHLGKNDYLKLQSFLIDTGAETVELLIPVVSRALHAVMRALGRPFHLSLCPGKAIGKVIQVTDLDEVPAEFSSVIAVVQSSKILVSDIPRNVKGIVQVGDFYISAQLVAHCLMHKIVFGVVEEGFREGVKGKVELRVETNKIWLL